MDEEEVARNRQHSLFIFFPIFLGMLVLIIHFFLGLEPAPHTVSTQIPIPSTSAPESQSFSETSPVLIPQTQPLETLPGASLLALGQKINLNQAGKEDLIALPGIGRALAEKILEDRQKRGPFRKIQDLMRVKGIKEKKFDQVKSFIFVAEVESSKSFKKTSNPKSLSVDKKKAANKDKKVKPVQKKL